MAWVFPVFQMKRFAVPERKGFSPMEDNFLASLAVSNPPNSCDGMSVFPEKCSVPFI